MPLPSMRAWLSVRSLAMATAAASGALPAEIETAADWTAGNAEHIRSQGRALEEDADHAQPLTLGILRQRRALRARLSSEPHLVVLDVAAGDVGDDGDVGVGHQAAGELMRLWMSSSSS